MPTAEHLRPRLEYRPLSKREIRRQGRSLHYDLLGPRESRTAFLMKSTSEELAEYQLGFIPEQYKPLITAAINTASESLEGVTRRDGLPHLRHALRVGIRTTLRLLAQHGSLTLADIEKIAFMINHDSQEDGRVKWGKSGVRQIFDTNMTPVSDGEQRQRIYALVNTFDQNIEEIIDGKPRLVPDPNYLNRLRDEELGPEKTADDTLDSMEGDMSKASTFILEGKKDKMPDALKQLRKSSKKTRDRKEFFLDQLTPYERDYIDISLYAAELSIKTLEKNPGLRRIDKVISFFTLRRRRPKLEPQAPAS